MTAPDSLPMHALAEDNLAAASPDLLRAMVKTFADALMSAEADALCNAEYGQVSDERVNHRNGYRPREWDTRAGTVELAIPKLRSGSYLERRRRAEQALISVVATAYLLGVSTRRVEKLAESLSVTQLSKSQVSSMAKHLDEQVAAFRNRPLDQGPYSFVWVDALTQQVREYGRIINVHALIAVGVNADGHLNAELLGIPRPDLTGNVHVTEACLARYNGEGPDAEKYGQELMGLYNVLEAYNALSRAA